MTHHPTNDPKATIKALQEQFKDLCAAGMRGAEAIANFRESPKESLRVVKDSDAEIKQGLSELKRELEAAKVPLANGEQIFVWEYQALRKLAIQAGISIEKMNSRITLENGSIVGLELQYCKIYDISWVKYFSALKTVDLSGNQIQDCSSISSLGALRWLCLKETPPQDLSHLEGLPLLEVLDLSNTQIKGATSFPKLKNLNHLMLSNTQIQELKFLAELSNLKSLYLDGTPIVEISAIAQLERLVELSLDNTKITDLSPLIGLKRLKVLYLNGTPAIISSAGIIKTLEERGISVEK